MGDRKAFTSHPLPLEETKDFPSLRQGLKERIDWHFVSPFNYPAWLWWSSRIEMDGGLAKEVRTSSLYQSVLECAHKPLSGGPQRLDEIRDLISEKHQGIELWDHDGRCQPMMKPISGEQCIEFLGGRSSSAGLRGDSPIPQGLYR